MPAPVKIVNIRQAIKQRLQGMSYADIGRLHGVTKSAAQLALKPIMDLIGDPDILKAYQDNRGDIMDNLQHALARKMLDPDKLEKASINNLAYAIRQVYDISRLEKGESTQNVAVAHVDALKTMDEVDREIRSITQELPDLDEKPEHYADDPKLKALQDQIDAVTSQDLDSVDDIPDDAA